MSVRRSVIDWQWVAGCVVAWTALTAFLQWGQGFDPVEGAVVGAGIGLAFGLFWCWLDRRMGDRR